MAGLRLTSYNFDIFLATIKGVTSNIARGFNMRIGLTKQYLEKILFMDEDGDLFWLSTGGLATHNGGRYLRVAYRGGKYYAHHIVWCLTHDEWPSEDIDHRDGNCRNNKPDNLRLATAPENLANADYGEFRGIEQHGRRFRIRVTVRGVRVIVGTYDTREEAAEAYRIWAASQFGEYAFHMR